MNKKQLLEAINTVKPGLANKEIVEQASNIIFMNDAVMTYNDEIAIWYPLDVGFTAAVPGKELYTILQKVKEDEIELNFDGTELHISKWSIKIQSDIKAPIDKIKPGKFTKISDDFIQAVKHCIFSASQDMIRPVLTGIYIDEDTVESCDNFRMTRCIIEPTAISPFLLPAKAAQELIKHEARALSLTDGWVHFKLKDKCVLSCRTIEGDYADLSKLLSPEKTYGIKFPSNMIEVLEEAAIALPDSMAHINITINKGELFIESSGDVVRYKDKIHIGGKNNFSFSVSPKHFIDILQHTLEADISDDCSKMIFKTDDFTHVMSLISK